MIHQIALFTVLGLPIVVIGGLLTLLSFAATAYIGFANYKKFEHRPPFMWHPTMVVVSFCFAIIHGFFALSIYWGY